MDTNAIIESRKMELADLYARMDVTKTYLDDTKYILKNYNDKTVDNVISVTMNVPKVFANNIISDLQEATKQIVVNGLSDKQNHIIEQFGDYAFAQADENLAHSTGEGGGLWGWLCKHVCVRSLIGARWTTTFDQGKYNIKVLPVDMRWCPFVFGSDGLSWAANLTFRNASEIQAEYRDRPGVDNGKLESLTGTNIEVRDYWDAQKNEIWVSGDMLLSQPNPYGSPPFVIILPSVGWGFRDQGYLKYEAEDIFYLIRDLIDELNRSVSIEQSLGMDILNPGMEQESSDGDLEADPTPKTGEILKVKKGERHTPVPRGDMNRASLTAREDIIKAIQQGSYNDIDLGNVNQTVSAVWITQQTSIRKKFENPRLQALAMFHQLSHRLIIHQATRMIPSKTLKIAVGRTGNRQTFNIQGFGSSDNYSIEYLYMTSSKTQEIANLVMAESARGLLPLSVILRDILLAEDPDGILRELEIEQARQADPAIGLFEMALRYAEEAINLEGDEADAKKIQSMMLTERGCCIIKQRMNPLEPPVPMQEIVPQSAGNRALLPLIGGNNMRVAG
jgi:hypothetical protein